MLLPQEVIRQKRDGKELTTEEIQFFVDGLVSGKFNDAQAGSMAMAIFQKGMATEELVTFTRAMMNSGDTMSWPEIDGPIVDKHSTGGVGDKVSFMLAAIVAACGGNIPMISGRGLGHTGGTADKLESIEGFNVQPTIEEFRKIVGDLGVSIISQTDNLAPADRRLYGIRDITGTVESIPLITASILSKKLSAGLDSLVMDVKCGNGAMMNNLGDAKELASTIVAVANGAGVKTEAIITDMNQPLGHASGNAVEMAETVEYLTTDKRDPRLHEIVEALAVSMLKSAKLASDETEAKAKIEEALSSGKAADIFGKMIAVMGGPADFMTNPWGSMEKAAVIRDVVAQKSGFIAGVDTRAVGVAIVAMGGGRVNPGQLVDHSVGFDHILPVGSKVAEGDVIARVHARTEEMADTATNEFLAAYEFSDIEPVIPPVIYEIIR